MTKLTKAQLIELVQEIRSEDDDEKLSELISLFEENVIMPNAYTLIFDHTPRLSNEEIVDKALSYKPIQLGSGDSNLDNQ